MKRNGVAAWKGGFTPKALQGIIDGYTRESGVRQLEREIASICRKVAKRKAETKGFPGKITPKNLASYLGIPKYRRQVVEGEPEVGVVIGMAWTSAGGEILPIEVAQMNGTGKLKLTGNLKDVMKESAETALSFARTRCPDLAADHLQKHDLHLHVPEGAVPKDGPSAGVAMATAMVSLLRGVPVRKDVAMTGEVTAGQGGWPSAGCPKSPWRPCGPAPAC